jgi:chemotaxis protein MotC
VLSGGEPVILKKLVELSSGQEQTLVRAALAYGENRNAAAAELLADVEPRKLDASIAGHVALVRSELLAKKDPDKALELLAEARLLAPGTMIEEAALRREAGLAADKGDAGRFGSAAALYFRRFANSVHMGNFRRQFAANVVAHSLADDGPRRSSMEAALAALPNGSQQELYLMVAWEGVRAGKMELVRWAAGKAAAIAPDGSHEQARAKLYEAAALVTTEELEKAMTTLGGISADKLDAEEEELLAAALHIGKEIRRAAEPPRDGDKPPPGVGVSAAAATAKKAIARVDALLSGEHR